MGVAVAAAAGSQVTCRRGALLLPPLKATAVRCPLPVMIKESALPACQPLRLTTSCKIVLRSGVRCNAPIVDQGAMSRQLTTDVDCGRDVRSKLLSVKGCELSAHGCGSATKWRPYPLHRPQFKIGADRALRNLDSRKAQSHRLQAIQRIIIHLQVGAGVHQAPLSITSSTSSLLWLICRSGPPVRVGATPPSGAYGYRSPAGCGCEAEVDCRRVGFDQHCSAVGLPRCCQRLAYQRDRG